MTIPDLRKCLNCDRPLTIRNNYRDRFCGHCGQEDKPVRRICLDLILEALGGVFAFNSRSWRTLLALLFKPGHLSNEYFSGRRVSYLAPIRLFFVFSLGFFLLLSFELFINSLTRDFSSTNLQRLPDSRVATSTGEIAEIRLADFVGPRRIPALQRFNVTNDDSERPRLPELVYRSIDQIELPFISDANKENLRL